MMNSVVLLLGILSCVSAQSKESLTFIYPGITTGGIQNYQGNSNTEAPVLYALWIPENAGELTVTFTNLNSDYCYYLDIALANDVIPCNQYQNAYGVDSQSDEFCSLGYDTYSGSTPRTMDFQPGDNYYYFQYKTNAYTYISVWTEGAYSQYCSYQIDISYQTCNGSNKVSVYQGGDQSACYTVSHEDVNSFHGTFSSDSIAQQLFSFDVPLNTEKVSIYFNASQYGYLYATNNYPTSAWNYDQYVYSSFGQVSVLDYYTPESGKLYIWVETYESQTISLFSSISICSSNLGIGCNSQTYQLNYFNLTSLNLLIPYETFQYVWFDIPWNSVYRSPYNVIRSSITVGRNGPNSAIYALYNKNRFASNTNTFEDSDQYQYVSSTSDKWDWVFSLYDFQVANVADTRVYISLYCYSSSSGNEPCPVNITFTEEYIQSSGSTQQLTTGNFNSPITTASYYPQTTGSYYPQTTGSVRPLTTSNIPVTSTTGGTTSPNPESCGCCSDQCRNVCAPRFVSTCVCEGNDISATCTA